MARTPKARRPRAGKDTAAPKARPRPKAKYMWNSRRVKALREHMGLTQAEFAEELGTFQQVVSQWERGYHYPTGLSVRLLNLVAEKADFAYGEAGEQKGS